MFFVVETKEQLAKLPRPSSCFISLITKSEDAHPKLTTPSLIYYNDFSKGYIFVVNHSEGFSLDLKEIQEFLSSIHRVYLSDAKFHAYFFNLKGFKHVVDVGFLNSNLNKRHLESDCNTLVHQDFYQRHRHLPNVNALIPISLHYERFECGFKKVEGLIKEFEQHPEDVSWVSSYTEAYKWVEEQGIALDERQFDKHFDPAWGSNSIKDGIIYTRYNLYNATSRPTNAFNGVNFLAIPKDSSRKAFIPHNDHFVEYDFDGYHIRLTAKLLHFPLPEGSIHTFLGKLYFHKEALTEEEYQESKKITFRQLYNGVEPEWKHIEFFQKVEEFVQFLWKEYTQQGFITLPSGKKISLENPAPQKVFNYFIQNFETVVNTSKLLQLKELLDGKATKVVLVVYDSMLIDLAEEEMYLLPEIERILEDGGYVVKKKMAKTYAF